MKQGVYNEWDQLTHVLVGNSKRLRVPSEVHWVINDYLPEAREQISAIANMEMADADPEFMQRFQQQGDTLAEILRKEGVQVSQHRDASEAEINYSDGAHLSGFTSFWARDPLIAVGPYLISTFCRQHMRSKEIWTQFEAVEKHCAASGQIHINLPMPPLVGERRGNTYPFLEGGDTFLMNNNILVGNSGIASSRAGIEWLRRLMAPLDIEVHEIELEPRKSIEGRWMHLDCVFATPREGLAMLVPEAIKGGIKALPAFMQDWEFLTATEEEAHALGCNLVNIAPNRSIIGAEHQRIIELLDKHKVELLTLEYDAPSIYGGGPRCSVQPLSRAS